ncbi:MAG: NAD(P)H-hydrate dehydratase, partial [Actinomycetota bacterium]
MLDVLTAEDVRRQDAACEARGLSTETLMGNAGYAIAAAARRMLGGAYGKRIVVACGKGNNGGDGLVAGRVLSAWGAAVTAVMVLGEDISGAAGRALERFPGPRIGPEGFVREAARADLVIDAIFGVGLSRAPEGPAAHVIAQLSSMGARVLSVDVPSGMNADTGHADGAVVHPHRTVTLGGLKPGLLFNGLVQAGAVEVADIGVPADLRGGIAAALEASDVAAIVPRRNVRANKRNVGTVLVIAGSRAMPGAAALVAGASVHTGSGLTTVAAPESAIPVIVSRVPECTTIPLPDSSEGTLDLKAVELIRPRLNEFHAVAIGPGLSRHEAAVEAILTLVAEIEVALVIDADAISAFAGTPEALRGRGAPLILTPHPGELSRLMKTSVFDNEADRLTAARDTAAVTGGHVLLPGTGTVVASPSGELFINPTGGPALAQGGSGDVLTGM